MVSRGCRELGGDDVGGEAGGGGEEKKERSDGGQKWFHGVVLCWKIEAER